jgi:hypothetical protein
LPHIADVPTKRSTTACGTIRQADPTPGFTVRLTRQSIGASDDEPSRRNRRPGHGQLAAHR